MTLVWRTQHEMPEHLPASAIIAVRDALDPDARYLLGPHMMTERQPGVWVDEDTDAAMFAAEFWWLPEDELLATLP